MGDRTIEAGVQRLALSDEGKGTAVVLAHGLTASRRYVVHGSKHLERSGHRVVAYDARGHGDSDPAGDPRAYGYADLTADLRATLDALGIERAVLAGASMGAHTIVRFALEAPERVAGLVLITPAYEPDGHADERRLVRWDALARALREDGIDGFVAAYGVEKMPEAWRATTEKVLRQRLARHTHLAAVADALDVVPRSAPFDALDELRAIRAPAVVVASRDEADPGHPRAVGERYAELLPAGRLLVEDEGASPLAWRGGQMAKVIAEVAAGSQGMP